MVRYSCQHWEVADDAFTGFFTWMLKEDMIDSEDLEKTGLGTKDGKLRFPRSQNGTDISRLIVNRVRELTTCLASLKETDACLDNLAPRLLLLSRIVVDASQVWPLMAHLTESLSRISSVEKGVAVGLVGLLFKVSTNLPIPTESREAFVTFARAVEKSFLPLILGHELAFASFVGFMRVHVDSYDFIAELDDMS